MTAQIDIAEPIALNQLDDAGRALMFTDAHTVNNFAPTPVTDAELSEIWELARWAPSAANLQPLRVVFLRTEEGRSRLVPLMNEGNRAKTAAAPAVAVLAFDSRFHEHVPTVMPFKPELQGVFEANEDMRVRMGTFSASIQVGYFILAVRALGLAAGPMGGFDAAGVDAEFFGDGRWRSLLVVNIGHPGADAWRDRLPRLEPEDVIDWA
jgi:3-hydroxypropanoate dehydrogenase